MLKTMMIAASIALISGCASNGSNNADASVQNKNTQLKAEAAELRREVELKRHELEALKNR